MDMHIERPWFTTFQVDTDDRPDSDVVWAEQAETPKAPMRKPTGKERASILAVGFAAIGGIVVMVIALVVAVYISRR